MNICQSYRKNKRGTFFYGPRCSSSYIWSYLLSYMCMVLVHVSLQRMNKLVGLFVNVETGLTCVINKASVGLLRPCDVVERLYLDPALEPRCVEDYLADHPVINTGNS